MQNETWNTCEACPIDQEYSMFDDNVCTKCEGFNQKSWDSCGSCSFDDDGIPLDCLSCTEESNK